ncbi:hypothetical protein AB1Y20_008810 [Prymnesium parvum]|uniref:Meiosis-specific nuclear structural protein 1 n=1 Tax=Prymnesium parvum TaxID=97485 RepID=A0AB34ISJ2_PRYPA
MPPGRLAVLRKACKSEAAARKRQRDMIAKAADDERERQATRERQAELNRRNTKDFAEICRIAKLEVLRQEEEAITREAQRRASDEARAQRKATKEHAEALRRGFFSAERRKAHEAAERRRREEARAARGAARAAREEEEAAAEAARQALLRENYHMSLRGVRPAEGPAGDGSPQL